MRSAARGTGDRARAALAAAHHPAAAGSLRRPDTTSCSCRRCCRPSSTSCSRAWRSRARTSSASPATPSCSSTRKKSRTSRCALRDELRRPRLPARRCGWRSPSTARSRSCSTCCENFDLPENAVYRINGPVNLNRVIQVYDLVQRPDLKYPPFQPRSAASTRTRCSSACAEGDVLLHHPFDSFAPVLELLKQAAEDPNVLAIKQTLYRTGKDSPIVEQLVQAARNGKDVTVVVELRARFDEEANLGLADRLQEAGVQVVYGVVGYKTHAKMLLIVRREGRKLRRYVHLGTGNYHSGTARAYTDFGLITADPDIGEDVAPDRSGSCPAWRRRSSSSACCNRRSRCTRACCNASSARRKHARAGKPARIIAKMNALNEPQVIRALYDASQAGVKIDLIVRGACALRPGVPGVSENIRVRSIVGRFLEHSRVYWFGNDGDPELFCSSADWLERNLLRRVETCFPILDPELAAARVRRGARQLPRRQRQRLGTACRRPTTTRVARRRGEMPHSAQGALLAKLCTMNDILARPARHRTAVAGRRPAGRGRPGLQQLPHGRGALRARPVARGRPHPRHGAPGRRPRRQGRPRARTCCSARSECLERFGQRLRDIPPQRVRAIATNTVRAAARAAGLPAAGGNRARPRDRSRVRPRGSAPGLPRRRPCATAEARRAAAGDRHRRRLHRIHHRQRASRRSNAKACRSVASPARGASSPTASCRRKRWKEALTEVTAEFQQFADTYRALGWQEALGSSGTNKAIGEICAAMKLTKGAVTAQALAAGARSPAAKPRRSTRSTCRACRTNAGRSSPAACWCSKRPSPCSACERMAVSKAALREGVLYDMLGRGGARRSARCVGRRADAALRHRSGAGGARARRRRCACSTRSPRNGSCTPKTARCSCRAARVARARPGHRAQPVPRARRLRARTLRHRRLLATGTARARLAGAHASARHSEVGVRPDPRSPALAHEEGRCAAPHRRAAASLARGRRDPARGSRAPTATTCCSRSTSAGWTSARCCAKTSAANRRMPPTWASR